MLEVCEAKLSVLCASVFLTTALIISVPIHNLIDFFVIPTKNDQLSRAQYHRAHFLWGTPAMRPDART